MMNFGFIGIGQGGGNIANTFAKDFPVIAINTAENDLTGLNNIPKHLRILTQISEGGAGKSIKYGEAAIIRHQEVIRDTIKMTMDQCDMIWLIAGLGGGTGSLGIIQMVQLLSKMGKKHSAIVTLPTQDEGTIEKANALIAAKQLYDIQIKSNNFRSLILVDNDKLKQQILDAGNFSYERFWDEANSLIYKKFKAFYDLSRLSGTTAFDVMDYKGMFDEKGCLVFAEEMIPFNDNENALASAVIRSWRNTVFLSGDVTKATAVAVIVQRPPGFDKGGKEINELYEAIKKQITSGKFCRGVYFNDSLLDKAADSVSLKTKPVKISSVVAGVAFPIEKIQELKARVDKEIADVKEKQKRESIDLDLGSYLDFVDRTNNENKVEELDFTIFKSEI